MRQHYATLGLENNASFEQVKVAYRALAKRYHPDANIYDKTAAEASFKNIGAAFAAIKKQRQDTGTSLHTQAKPFHKSNNGYNTRYEAPLRPQSRKSASKEWFEGTEIISDISMTLEQAFHGGLHQFNIETLQYCSLCAGSGVIQSRLYGFSWLSSACIKCRGNGCFIRRGRLQALIPPGVGNNEVLPLRLESVHSLGVRIHITLNRRFLRQDNDLIVIRHISRARANKGTTLTIKCIDGAKMRARVPPGTVDGLYLRLRGQGMKSTDGRRGDLLVHLNVGDK